MDIEKVRSTLQDIKALIGLIEIDEREARREKLQLHIDYGNKLAVLAEFIVQKILWFDNLLPCDTCVHAGCIEQRKLRKIFDYAGVQFEWKPEARKPCVTIVPT